jgi:hypothetical protein
MLGATESALNVAPVIPTALPGSTIFRRIFYLLPWACLEAGRLPTKEKNGLVDDLPGVPISWQPRIQRQFSCLFFLRRRLAWVFFSQFSACSDGGKNPLEIKWWRSKSHKSPVVTAYAWFTVVGEAPRDVSSC